MRQGTRLLDVVRGIAALLVVFGHSRQFFLNATDTKLSSLSTLQIALLIPSSVAQESVAVFFVLSGYLVGGQVIRQLRRGTFTWRLYLTKRLSRMWTVLLPGLVLSGALAIISLAEYPAVSSRITHSNLSWQVAVCNAVFLQESRCSTYATNVALWSLSYEFWFYGIFAAASSAIFALREARARAAALNMLGAVLIVLIFGPKLFLLMPAWLIGVAVAEFEVARPSEEQASGRWKVAGSVVVLGCAMMASNYFHLDRTSLTFVVAFPAAALVYTASRFGTQFRGRVVDCLARLGDWSFSLYVLHAPALVLLIAWAFSVGMLQSMGPIAATYVCALLVLFPAWAVAQLTERHTAAVRDWMTRAMGSIGLRNQTHAHGPTSL
jgi:peptidoglycan/LPS O-acetylase OafA/YrhL